MGMMEIILPDGTHLGALIFDSNEQNISSAVWGYSKDEEKAKKDAEKIRNLKDTDRVIINYPYRNYYAKSISIKELVDIYGEFQLGRDYDIIKKPRIERVSSVEELLDKASECRRR